jgi:hypothetical protein
MMPYTLLLTARDTGAAMQIGEIARNAWQHPSFAPVLYAAAPADHVLRGMGLEVVSIDTPVVFETGGSDYEILFRTADEVLNKVKPDAVLTGLSGPGAGIDEAIIARATGIPCYTFQDYWGDVNHLFGKIADCYFTLDDCAARLTRERFHADVCITGSPKHASYARLDTGMLRIDMRNQLEAHLVIGLFGQPVKPETDYLDNIERFAATLSQTASKLIYRPHPDDSPEMNGKVLKILYDQNLAPVNGAHTNLIEMLCGCDLVCSTFSSCNLDNIYLNYYSPAPLGLSVYLFLNDRMKDIHRTQTGQDHPPIVDEGFAVRCSDKGELLKILEEHKELRNRYWQQIRQALPDPEQAASKVLDKIKQDLG